MTQLLTLTFIKVALGTGSYLIFRKRILPFPPELGVCVPP